jgi:hypothetical protein
MADATRHTRTQQLLIAELDAQRFSNAGYLPWFYDDNPRGAALEEHEDDPDSGRRIGHYGVLPTRFRHGATTLPFIFSTNVATDSTIRRGGVFRTMAKRMYERAAATGAPAMVGVGNDASTVVVVERFGWRQLRPMRARLALPIAWRTARQVENLAVTADLLAGPRFVELTAQLDWVPVEGWAQSWDTAFARWRLARPDGGYAVHIADDLIAVSTRAHAPLGVPACVLLKLWPRPGAALPLRADAVATAACRHHRTPVCVYAGWNRHVAVRGVPIPARLQPSPLNVVLKVLDADAIDATAFELDTWELLDMDAY